MSPLTVLTSALGKLHRSFTDHVYPTPALLQGNHCVLVSHIDSPTYSLFSSDIVIRTCLLFFGSWIWNGGFWFLRTYTYVAITRLVAIKLPPPRPRRRMNSRQSEWKPPTQQSPRPGPLSFFSLVLENPHVDDIPLRAYRSACHRRRQVRIRPQVLETAPQSCYMTMYGYKHRWFAISLMVPPSATR